MRRYAVQRTLPATGHLHVPQRGHQVRTSQCLQQKETGDPAHRSQGNQKSDRLPHAERAPIGEVLPVQHTHRRIERGQMRPRRTEIHDETLDMQQILQQEEGRQPDLPQEGERSQGQIPIERPAGTYTGSSVDPKCGILLDQQTVSMRKDRRKKERLLRRPHDGIPLDKHSTANNIRVSAIIGSSSTMWSSSDQ